MAFSNNIFLIPFLFLNLFLLFQSINSICLKGPQCEKNNDCCSDYFCRFKASGTGTCKRDKACLEKDYIYCDNQDNRCCKGLSCKTDIVGGRSVCRPYNCVKEHGDCDANDTKFKQCCYGFFCQDKKCKKCMNIYEHICIGWVISSLSLWFKN